MPPKSDKKNPSTKTLRGPDGKFKKKQPEPVASSTPAPPTDLRAKIKNKRKNSDKNAPESAEIPASKRRRTRNSNQEEKEVDDQLHIQPKVEVDSEVEENGESNDGKAPDNEQDQSNANPLDDDHFPQDSSALKGALLIAGSVLANLRDNLDICHNKYNEAATNDGEIDREDLERALDYCRASLDNVENKVQIAYNIPDFAFNDPRIIDIEGGLGLERKRFRDLETQVSKLLRVTTPSNSTQLPSGVTMQSGIIPPISCYRSHIDPRKDGITFAGDSSRNYEAFRIGWQSVEARYQNENRPRIDLFRTLKRCLTGSALELVKDIRESESSVAQAFDILDSLYRRPLESVLETYSKLQEPMNSTRPSDILFHTYKCYSHSESVRSTYCLSAEEESALLLISLSIKNFSKGQTIEFHKYLLKHHYDEGHPLKYRLDRNIMRDFLSQQIKIQSNSNPKAVDNQRSERPSHPLHKRRSIATVSSSFKTSTNSSPCYICGRNNHRASDCRDKFKMSPQELLKLTRVKRICQGCFGPFKGSSHACSIKCEICGNRHIKYLHQAVIAHEKETKTPTGGRKFTPRSGFSPNNGGLNSASVHSKPGFQNNFKKRNFQNNNSRKSTNFTPVKTSTDG